MVDHLQSKAVSFVSENHSTSSQHDEVEEFISEENPLFLMGKRHLIHTHFDVSMIRRRFNSLFWLTYRRNFTPIGGTGPTTDTGWGCMLRCGQMLISNAFLRLWLGSEYIWEFDPENALYRKILCQFLDDRRSSYSIHQIAQMGVSEGKPVGDWFGPNTVAQVLRKMAFFDDFTTHRVHVALDNTIVIEDIYKTCLHSSTPSKSGATSEEHKLSWVPLILLIPLRLGLTDLNPLYIPSLKACMRCSFTIGLIGGRPNYAFYFIGYQGDRLLYMDPHFPQNVSTAEKDDASYHCKYPSKMPFMSLDPSLAIAFLCKSKEEFTQLLIFIRNEIMNLSNQPMFEIVEKRPQHWPPFQDAVYGTQETVDVESDEDVLNSDDDFVIIADMTRQQIIGKNFGDRTRERVPVQKYRRTIGEQYEKQTTRKSLQKSFTHVTKERRTSFSLKGTVLNAVYLLVGILTLLSALYLFFTHFL